MVNTFRAQMPRPLIGIGHSMGGCQLTNLALLHPRLLETLVLIDPVLNKVVTLSGNVSPAHASLKRRDRWPSREEAAKSMLRNRFYQAWDKRVFDRWIRYGLRDLPTGLYPDEAPEKTTSTTVATTEPTATPAPLAPKQVTLTTTKHQEVMTFLRPNFAFRAGVDSEPSSAAYSTANPTAINRRTHPDLLCVDVPQSPFYRGESMMVFRQLPHLRPSVFYIFGSESNLTTDPASIPEKMALTGSGDGGSGGEKEGRVANVVIKDTGHLIPMEKVEETAMHAASWIGKEISRWWDGERRTEAEWGARKGVERRVLTDRYVEELSSIGKVTAKAKSKL